MLRSISGWKFSPTFPSPARLSASFHVFFNARRSCMNVHVFQGCPCWRPAPGGTHGIVVLAIRWFVHVVFDWWIFNQFCWCNWEVFFFFLNGTGSRPWNRSTHWPARISVVPGREPVLYNTALKHIFWSFYWLTHWVRTMCSNYPRDIPCMTSSLTVYMPDLLQSSGSHGIPDQEIHLYLLPNEWISVHSTYFSRSTCINYRMKWPPWEDS